MTRKVEDRSASVESLGVVTGEPTLAAWLLEQSAEHGGAPWLLAHAEDGVIWGRVQDGQLLTSHEAAPGLAPALDAATLWTARLFGEQAELLLWREDDGLHGRWIVDLDGGSAPWSASLDEEQILWGDTCEAAPHEFTILADGAQGLVHVAPLRVTARGQQDRPLRLQVRHYLAADETGAERVVASRLVGLREVNHG